MKCPKCGCEMTCKTIDASQQWYEYRCPKCGYGNGYATIPEERNPDCPIVSASEIEVEQKWRDLRNQAAIAAMQGTITILGSSDRYAFRDIVVEGYKGEEKTYPKEIAQFAVACADAIITELKKK